MRSKISVVLFTLPLLLLVLASEPTANAQQYQPALGQEGKDVIWVPTPEELVKAMLDMAKVSADDFVMDLGSGDGRIVIAAAKRGARAIGIEYNPEMVDLSKRNAQKEGVSDKADFMNADLFETDFSKATVVTMYLLPDLNMKLRPKILDMRPGTRVVSHAFSMEDWEADRTEQVEGRTAYLWIVPAKVVGTWNWQTPTGNAELTLRQSFQKIEGTLKSGGGEQPIRAAKLEGDRISFAVSEGNPTVREFAGRVNGGSIEGTTKTDGGPETKWVATRGGR